MTTIRVLVIGSGGREHAIAWKLAQDPRVEAVYALPGNAGAAAEAKVVLVSAEAGRDVARLAEQERIDLVVIGPEAPLVDGLADELRACGVRVVGPGADGAQLEGSKAFCKEVMIAAGVPTARYARVTEASEVHAFVDACDCDALVVKADGLAAGKGVVVCDDRESARAAALDMLKTRPFGDASATVVLEERLFGVETSAIVLTDGERFVFMPSSQDHKRLLDGDRGPNTGGMGAYSPAPFVTTEVAQQIEDEVIIPTLAELKRRGIEYRGFLYAGIMLTASGPQVLEFNVRLGDPETQALMMALDGGLLDALLSCADGRLDPTPFSGTRASAVVVLAAEGYPESPVRGARIVGIEDAASVDRVKVFHAGTRSVDNGQGFAVDGGRVLGVAAYGETPEQAIASAYEGVARVGWPGMQVRRDIGNAL